MVLMDEITLHVSFPLEAALTFRTQNSFNESFEPFNSMVMLEYLVMEVHGGEFRCYHIYIQNNCSINMDTSIRSTL